MSNPYVHGSDYDSMAGGGRQILGPAKFALGRPGRPVRPAQMVNPAMAQAFEAARGDESIFGMDSGAVLIVAGATATVNATPQKPCIITRMVVSDATANFFALSSLTVGVESLLLTNGVNCSLAAFTAPSQGGDLRSTLCHVGNTISAIVTNLDGAGHRFIATLYAVPWTYFGA